MLSLLDAMKASAGYSRPMRSGEELLQSGMVVSVGIKGKEKDIVHVQALVLRTSGLNSKHPGIVEMWIDLNKEYEERLICDNEQEISKECDCPAGSAEKFKHILAVMLYLARYSRREFCVIIEEGELEDLSCTDIEHQWGALKTATLKEYEVVPLSEMCHVRGQWDVLVTTMPEVTKEMDDRWRIKLINSVPHCEYSLFTSCLRRGDGMVDSKENVTNQIVENTTILKNLLTFTSWRVLGDLRRLTEEKLEICQPELINFYEKHVAVSLDQSIKIISTQQGSRIWHNARKIRQTAYNARAQYTYYINHNANWDKRYQELFHSRFIGNEDTLRGLRCEPLAREIYVEEFGCTILESGLLVRPESPWLSASLDGTVLDLEGNFVRNIEIKILKEGTRLTSAELVEMNIISTLDENGNVKRNTSHYYQMQLGMLLSGMAECDYLVYSEIGKDFVQARVPFNENDTLEFCSRLINVYFDEFLPRMVAEYGSDNNFNVV